MAKPIVALSENVYTRGEENIFKICGAGLKPGSGNPDPVIELESNYHNWGAITIIGINPKWICISSTPTRKPTSTRKATATTEDDDITVTITYDDGTSTEEVTITCEEVEFIDPP